MLEVKLKLFATQTYKRDLACRCRLGALTALVFAAVCGLAAVPARAEAPKFQSVDAAMEQGISAYVGGYYEIAIPALEFAAAKKNFFARYYLAKLYGNNTSAHTNHARSYMLYQGIANDYTDIDPEDSRRAPYVADSLVKLARYMRDGLEEIGLATNTKRAAEYLHHAAVFFSSEDAQFELAKMRIVGEGVPTDIKLGRHWLAKLSRLGHPGAQAFFADLYWRGKIVERDQVQALALISVAVKNALAEDRVWIDDIYQNIYCGAPKGVRQHVAGMVAEWDNRYGRKPLSHERHRSELGFLDAQPVRTCSNGEVLPMRRGTEIATEQPPNHSIEPNKVPDVMRGGAGGRFKFRDAGDVSGDPLER
ncbi:MAG: tetratricopeptide repeat protein [Hyphomicrobiaceae bacterium]